MAQRGGCTAFNPWHGGLPCSVWKHQLHFSELGPFSEGPSSRDDVAPGGLTHTDDSSTWLSGVVRGRERLSHRPQLTQTLKIVLKKPFIGEKLQTKLS